MPGCPEAQQIYPPKLLAPRCGPRRRGRPATIRLAVPVSQKFHLRKTAQMKRRGGAYYFVIAYQTPTRKSLKLGRRGLYSLRRYAPRIALTVMATDSGR